MRTRVLILVALAGGLGLLAETRAGGSPIPKHLMKKDANPDHAKIQGKWKLTELRMGGMNIGGGGAAGLDLTIEFRGDTFRLEQTAPGGGHRAIAKFKLDTANGVKRLTSTDTQRLDAGGKPTAKEKDQAIGYAIDGETMTWAVSIGGERQKPIDPSKADAGAVLMVFTRVKDKN